MQQFEESEMGVVWKQRRQEWEAEGWMQPAVWDQCLEWIDGQWGRWAVGSGIWPAGDLDG